MTYAWLTFSADLSSADPGFWMLLGEAVSQCEHMTSVALPAEQAKRLSRLCLSKGVFGNAALDGNTLSEEEVVKHIEGKLHLPVSRQYLAKEIDNILSACDRISSELKSRGEVSIDVGGIQRLNREVLDGAGAGEGVVGGTIRSHSVDGLPYRTASAEDCEYLLDRLCTWLAGTELSPPGLLPERRLAYAILRAILAHLYLAWIHPFMDGNGRTARLTEFQILAASGVPAAAAHTLGSHYNLTRAEYYRQLDQSSQSEGNVILFMRYALRGFVAGLRTQLKAIQTHQWEVAWETYVHSRFRGRTSESDLRKRHLVLDLSRQEDPVPPARIREISARIAKAYATRSSKTLTRDLSALSEMGLIESGENGYKPKQDVLLAFPPLLRES